MIPVLKQSTPQDNPDHQTTIVNLSAVHQLKPIREVLNKFADLHYQYAPSWFGKWYGYSQLWTRIQFFRNQTLINNYKLGKITTDEFIKTLSTIFDFIPSGKNPTQLLTDAWNSLIVWDAKSTERLKTLISKNEPIYFISNTNPLNIEKIIEFFNENYPDITWQIPEEATIAAPLKLADNFYLCPSYQFKEFKEGTPGLIAILKQYLLAKGEKLENILLVSQYKPDLVKAGTLGIKSEQADQFFPAIPAAISSPSPNPLNNTTTIATTQADSFPLPNLVTYKPFFVRPPNNEANPAATTSDSEKTPLLRQ
jgi:hypothetical protein